MTTQKSLLFLIVGGVLMLILPPALMVVMMGGQAWAPSVVQAWGGMSHILYWVTLTGSNPYALLSCVLILAMIWAILRCTWKQIVMLGVIFACAIGMGQAIKSTMKNISQEPRPYVHWLEKGQFITAEAFYQKSREERRDFILAQDFSREQIPSWLQAHWADETGYSFPSGHTIFAAQWALMLLLLFSSRRHYLPIVVFFLWAWAVEISRILLGMHRLSDVVISCVLAAIFSYVAHQAWQKWVLKRYLFR